MKISNVARRFPLIVFVIFVFGNSAFAQTHWVGTWAAAPAAMRVPTAPPAAGATPPVSSFQDQTVRMTVHTTIGGSRARVQLSNTFGNAPLTIGTAHVAVRSEASSIVAGSDRTLLFNGKPTVTIPVGAQMMSDPVDLAIPQLGDLAISVYVPGESGQLTIHGTALHTTYIGKGNQTTAASIADAQTTRSWYWITAVDVMAPDNIGAIVTFGDSITDGLTSTVDADHSWPSVLSQRLLISPGAPKYSVLNVGISGNRLLADGAGVNALARFDRDVLGQSGAKWLMILEGINDIGITTGPPRGNDPPVTPVTADELIGVVKQMIEKAHSHGMKVIGCTLTPFEGAIRYSEKGEEVRRAFNRWILTSKAFDFVLDFDKVTRDPRKQKSFLPTMNNTDHLHPNDAGYKAMADSIDLAIFGKW